MSYYYYLLYCTHRMVARGISHMGQQRVMAHLPYVIIIPPPLSAPVVAESILVSRKLQWPQHQSYIPVLGRMCHQVPSSTARMPSSTMAMPQGAGHRPGWGALVGHLSGSKTWS